MPPARPPVDELVEVEIEDAPGLEPGDGPATRTPPGAASADAGARRLHGRRVPPRALVGALATAALVGVVVGVNVAEQQAAAQRRAELAAVPGVVSGDLGRPLQEAWVLPGQWDWVVPSQDLLVVGSWGGSRVAAVDAADGSVRWRIDGDPLTGTWCTPTVDPVQSYLGGFVGLTTTFPLDARPDTLLCAPQDGLQAYDLASGALLGALPLYEFGTYRLLGDDVVAVVDGDDGTPDVVRWSPRTARTLWRQDVGAAVPDRESEDVWGWGLDTDGEVVAVYTDRTIVLDAASGAVLDPAAAAVPGQVLTLETLRDGTRLTLEYGQRGEVGTVREPDGSVRHRFDARLVPVLLRDGSAQDVLLTMSGEGVLAAASAETGRVLWERPDLRVELPVSVLALSGRALVVADGRVHALDVADGRTVWEAAVPVSVTAGPVSDGTHVVLPALDDGVFSLVSRRLDDGSEVWRAPLARGTYQLGAVDDLVLATTSQGLVASRPVGRP